MAKKWQDAGIYKVEKNKSKKILCTRNVPVPIWKDPYGSCEKLYAWRCGCAI